MTTADLLKSFRPGIYRHYKNGHLYMAIGIALDTDNAHDVPKGQEPVCVVYVPLYETDAAMFVQPIEQFMAWVPPAPGNTDDEVRRFMYVGNVPEMNVEVGKVVLDGPD